MAIDDDLLHDFEDEFVIPPVITQPNFTINIDPDLLPQLPQPALDTPRISATDPKYGR